MNSILNRAREKLFWTCLNGSQQYETFENKIAGFERLSELVVKDGYSNLIILDFVYIKAS